MEHKKIRKNIAAGTCYRPIIIRTCAPDCPICYADQQVAKERKEVKAELEKYIVVMRNGSIVPASQFVPWSRIEAVFARRESHEG